MLQFYGDFIEPADDQEYLIIHFSPTSRPLQRRWRGNGLSADFLAEYWGMFFTASDELSQQRQAEIKGAVSYIANELLENVMKFSYKPADYAVTLGLYLSENEMRFYSYNAIDPQEVETFRARIHDLTARNPRELYLQQLKYNVQNEAQGVSHLGLLTMINDYGARLAWQIRSTPTQPDRTILTTMVQLIL